MKYFVSYATRGKDNRENQDNFLIDRSLCGCDKVVECGGYLVTDDSEIRVFAVADGAGGEADGCKASQIATSVLYSRLEDIKQGNICNALRLALDQANTEAASYFEQLGERGASTLSGVVLDKDWIWIFNIGDSPVYRIKKCTITQISCDHVRLPKEAAASSEEERIAQNTLTHYLGNSGASGAEQAFSTMLAKEAGLTLVIASDGVPKGVSERLLLKLTKKNEPHIAETIVKEAYKRGADDDITVIVIRILDDEA